MIATRYEYPVTGAYNETVATLPNGRVYTVNTQYKQVMPHGDHAEGCAQVTKMGGICDCGLLDGVDVDALVAEAREHGLRGRAPREDDDAPTPVEAPEWRSERGLTLSEEMGREDTIY